MFVYSIKTSKGKLLGILAVVAIAIILMIIVFSGGGADAETASTKSKVSAAANTAAERVQFLAQYGWEVKEEPLSVTEVMIPEKFDDTYEEYNVIQKKQGMDLSKHKGKSAKKWTYEITNYPKSDAKVQANLLVLNGKVIGGDVSSTDANGFMHGFSLDTATSTTVDVMYDVNEDGIIVVQGGITGGEGDGGITDGGTGGGDNAGTSSNPDTNAPGTGGSSGDTGASGGNGSSNVVDNPQTGDRWY